MEQKQNIWTKPISKQTIYKLVFLALVIAFALPSIFYLIEHKTVYRFYAVFTYLFTLPRIGSIDTLINTVLYVILFSGMFFLYGKLVKKKNSFSSMKTLMIFIIIVSIFFMAILPYTSLDVYSYIGHGWVASHYHENPYYVPVGEIIEEQGFDPIFHKMAVGWRFETVVYGPVWTSICTVLSTLSMGNIDFALFLFKLINLLLHLANCLLIYKITKRKLWVGLYGLNPFILFEFLTNGHNDIFLIFFILLAIYFVRKKKNLGLAVASLAMAAGIKYITILLLPFLVLYMVREKKLKDKIKHCMLYGIEFLIILAIWYMIYLRDWKVFAGILIQQEKVTASLLSIVYYMAGQNMQLIEIIKFILMALFFIGYVYIIIKIGFCSKNVSFTKMMRSYQVIILIFLFFIITNFRFWYIGWLIPTIFWQNTKMIRMTNYIAYASQMANCFTIYQYVEDDIKVGIPSIILVVCLPLLLEGIRKIYQKQKKKEIQE